MGPVDDAETCDTVAGSVAVQVTRQEGGAVIAQMIPVWRAEASPALAWRWVVRIC